MSRSLLVAQPLPRGRRVALLTNAGGLGILCADACAAAGLELPPLSDETRTALAELLPREASLANPIDMLGSAVGSTYEAVLPLRARRPGHRRCDRALRAAGRRRRRGGRRGGRPGRRARAEDATSRCSPRSSAPRAFPAACSDAGSGVATFEYPESAARALGHAADRADWLRRPAGGTPEPGRDRPRCRAGARRVGARVLERRLADRAAGARAARCVRHPARARADRDDRSRTRSPPPASSASRSSSRRRRRRAQDRERRDRARPRHRGRRHGRRRADRTAGARPADGPAAAPSCSPASSRIRSSARSSRSAPAASSPS